MGFGNNTLNILKIFIEEKREDDHEPKFHIFGFRLNVYHVKRGHLSFLANI